MIKQEINILNYWKIIVCYDVFLGQDNAGFTHTDYAKKLSIVGIGKADSKEQFINTIAHEAKHIQSHICKYYHVREDGEKAAYLLGYIIMKMYRAFRDMI